MNKLLVFVLTLGLAGFAFAQDSDFSNLTDFSEAPEEVLDLIGEQAQELGFDIDSKKGQRDFRRHLKKEHMRHAKRLGFNLKTPMGRTRWMQYQGREMDKVAKEFGFDLNTPEGRDAMANHFIDKGQLGMIPMEPKRYQKHGWKPGPQPIDVRKMPKEVQGLMAEKAADLGIDITTTEGQKELGQFMDKQKRSEAKKLGYSLDSFKGRKAYRGHVRKELKKMARQAGTNMNTPKGREATLRRVVKNGQFGMVPQRPREFRSLGFDMPRPGHRGPRDLKRQDNSKSASRGKADSKRGFKGRSGASVGSSRGHQGGRDHSPRQNESRQQSRERRGR